MVHTQHRGGARWYVRPETSVSVPGVTSIIGATPKPWLTRWETNFAADTAIDNLEVVQRLVGVDRAAARDFISGAARRYTKLRSSVGSEAHDLFERMIRGERPGSVHADMVPYRDRFAEWLDATQPILLRAEDVAWSETHGYAGSYDAILRVLVDENGTPDRFGEPVTLICDWKTSKDVHADVALQLAAYRYADTVLADDAESPMLPVDGGAVLHIKPDSCNLHPVNTGEEVFGAFLERLKVFNAIRAAEEAWKPLERKVIGKPIYSAGTITTGTQRRG